MDSNFPLLFRHPHLALQEVYMYADPKELENVPCFPLFTRLPFLARKEVVKLMDYMDLVNFSLCSRRSKEMVKACRDKFRKLKIHVTYSKHRTIEIPEEGYCRRKMFEILPKNNKKRRFLRIGSENIPYSRTDNNEIITYFKDCFYGITFLLTYITDLFDCKIEELYVTSNGNPKDPWRFIHWVMSRQDSIEDIHLEYDDKNPIDEHLRTFLDTCKVTKRMGLYIKPSENFRHTFSLNTDSVSFYYGKWITFDNLLSMNSQKIWIAPAHMFEETHRISSWELNTYLMKWMNGELPKLKILQFDMKDHIMAVIMEGLDGRYIENNTQKSYSIGRSGKIDVSRSIRLQNKHGVYASIPIINNDNSFQFVVWPDFDGNEYQPVNIGRIY